MQLNDSGRQIGTISSILGNLNDIGVFEEGTDLQECRFQLLLCELSEQKMEAVKDIYTQELWEKKEIVAMMGRNR